MLSIVSSLFLLNPAFARDDSAWGVVKSTAAIFLGTPVSFFTGMARGGTVKGANYADALSENMGDGTAANIIGKPVGFVGGLAAGGIAGAIKGVYNGIYYGVKEPFSRENFTVEGDFMDFDPYNFDEYSSDYSYSSI